MKLGWIRCGIAITLVLECLLLWQPGALLAQDSTPDAQSSPPAEQISFSLNPKDEPDGSFFEFDAKPGSTKKLAVEFSNLYSQPLSLRSFVSDAFTLVNGGLGVRDEGQNTQAPTPWISYPTETYDLDPQEAREVSFDVTVPKDAAPGNYVSVLVLQTTEAVPVEGTVLFDQIIRKAIAIDITVPGKESPSFTIGEVSYAEGPNVPSLQIAIENTGNVRLRPAGSMAVTDETGATVLSSDVAMGSVYAGTSTTLQFALQQPLSAGSYAVSLNLTDPETKATASTDAVALKVTTQTAASQSLVAFTDLTLTPLPDATAPQFASIAGTITNGGAPIPNARLTLQAFKDGEDVESFPLIPSLSLAQGETAIEQRYIPATGFTTGTWSFSLTLESLDPASGTATLLITQELEQTFIVA